MRQSALVADRKPPSFLLVNVGIGGPRVNANLNVQVPRFFVGLPPRVFVAPPVFVVTPRIIVTPGVAALQIGPVVIVASRPRRRFRRFRRPRLSLSFIIGRKLKQNNDLGDYLDDSTDYEGDFTDEDGNLVGSCRQGVCYPYNSDYMTTAVEPVPFDDVSTVFNNNQAAGKINSGVFNSDPNALIAGGKINTFHSIFNAKAGDNAAQTANNNPSNQQLATTFAAANPTASTQIAEPPAASPGAVIAAAPGAAPVAVGSPVGSPSANGPASGLAANGPASSAAANGPTSSAAANGPTTSTASTPSGSEAKAPAAGFAAQTPAGSTVTPPTAAANGPTTSANAPAKSEASAPTNSLAATAPTQASPSSISGQLGQPITGQVGQSFSGQLRQPITGQLGHPQPRFFGQPVSEQIGQPKPRQLRLSHQLLCCQQHIWFSKPFQLPQPYIFPQPIIHPQPHPLSRQLLLIRQLIVFFNSLANPCILLRIIYGRLF
ncbi:hypothetical protein COCSUDRAFT_56283 [Coccomyxa subellipsoidea C-169]|uniref:Uncharacterized protein n=1 Tax=Coccomyxa subellipsoidea (strain C-169) TaxID=574566 RepID=I0YTW3_COCSC|nr:hypothetical protein COCSUDRAFT_56283 [Coccomyxa subellipsoidea C-169]EIE21832.1 hypothetical protein COCSUDRAFT_56283 [Coccomyxa subellipsoidea C-169]|eukprot:XP_005646376.1 hypothetical protein COCSUDRAFT_56283 [Coccomyxa subellipsoidea C-169]